MLVDAPWSLMQLIQMLRSSPTPEGRCWAGLPGIGAAVLKLRSSPTPEGRCWEAETGTVDVEGQIVAILTDPGGPVLGGIRRSGRATCP